MCSGRYSATATRFPRVAEEIRSRTLSAARSTLGCTTVPRKGDPSVVTEATSFSRWLAAARAMIPPRLWPIR